MWLSCSPKSWQLFIVGGQLNTSSSCRQCLSTQYLLQSMYRKHWWWNATVLMWRDSCCKEACHYLLTMIMVDLICRFMELQQIFRWQQHSVGSFDEFCNICRAPSRCNASCSVVRCLWFFESHWPHAELKRISNKSCHIVPEMPSRLSGFRALAVYDRCNHGSVRLVLWCQFSGVVELMLNRNPSPCDMRNLEIEVWMSVQCCYNQGRRSLSNKEYELMWHFSLFVMSMEWMAEDSIMPCLK